MREAVLDGVDINQLDKISVQSLSLSRRVQRKIQEHFVYGKVVTVADLVRAYHDRLIYEDTATATEIKEYLYRQGHVIRPENMPMDECTHIAYLGIPTRVRMSLCYPGNVEMVDDLVWCCLGNDPVFSLQYITGIGKKSMEIIRTRLVELGFLPDSQ